MHTITHRWHSFCVSFSSVGLIKLMGAYIFPMLNASPPSLLPDEEDACFREHCDTQHVHTQPPNKELDTVHLHRTRFLALISTN